MWRLILISLFSVGLLATAGVALPISAHEVLPQAYLTFVQENPQFTKEQFASFLQLHPELASDQDFLSHVQAASDPTSAENTFRTFVRLGIFHILEGTDHVLFVISLILIYTTFRRELLLLTTFTVAHSISLILAGSGILTLSSRIVEPVVALSITYMAISSVFLKDRKFFGAHGNKISTIFVFGLFHGLGFAGLLKNIQVPDDQFLLSLFSFNVGIEIGQLLILTVALPFVFFGKNYSWYPRAIQTLALVISAIGLYWGFERIFFQ